MKKLIILLLVSVAVSCKTVSAPTEIKFICSREEFNLAVDRYNGSGYQFYNAYDLENGMIKVIMKKSDLINNP